MEENKKLDHIEFESKYRVETLVSLPFKMLVEKMPTFREYIYAEGPDDYFINEDKFIRYRRESHKGLNSRAELTMKIKMVGAKNNIIREEYNVRVDGTPKETILKMLTALDFKYNFTVTKFCHIYRMEDATLVYYSVLDTTDDKVRGEDHFVEIEVDEATIHTKTEAEAWEVIIKYEKALEVIGINAQKRLRKSLFEMYKRD